MAKSSSARALGFGLKEMRNRPLVSGEALAVGFAQNRGTASDVAIETIRREAGNPFERLANLNAADAVAAQPTPTPRQDLDPLTGLPRRPGFQRTGRSAKRMLGAEGVLG